MRTLVLAIFASLLLLLHATAEAHWQPPTWPPDVTQPYYWGDVLNITKCYCGDTMDAAYYYQFDYRNFHNMQDYTLGWTCDSEPAIDGWGTVGGKRTNFILPLCWNTHALWRKHKRKECSTSYNGDKFCYELGNTRHPVDHYFFNGQKRKLPVKGITEFPPDQCASLCRVKFQGKDIASEYHFRRISSLSRPLGPFVGRKACLTSGSNYQKCFTIRAFCLNEAMLISNCLGDTEGGWEKSLPSKEKPLMALKSSFQMFTDLDDVVANRRI